MASSGRSDVLTRGELVLDVRDFGAVGDNTHDDTAGIQAAVNAAAGAGGGQVYLPAGTYLVSGTITVNHDAVHLIGAGIGATTVKTTHATADVFALGDGVTLRTWLTVADMVITASVARTAGAFINANLVADLDIKRCRLAGAFTAINLLATQMTRLTELHIINCTPATGAAVIADGNGTNLYLTRVGTDAPNGSQPRCGIALRQWDGVFLTDSQCNHSGIGLVIEPAGGQTFQHLYAVDCSFDTNANHGSQVAGPGTVRRLWFTGCWFGSNTVHGVATGGAPTGVSFVGCKFVANGQHGLNISAGSDFTIADPFISGNSASAAGTFSGVNIAAGVSRVKIMGGDSRPFAGFADTQAFGINIGAGGDFIVVDSVNCDGNTANAGAGLFNGATGTHVAIRNCYPYNPRGHAVTQPAIPASTVAFTNNTGVDCMVHVAGGTVTVIAVGGTATGLTSGSFRVPVGQTITLTYSVAPTWQWFGD